MPLMAAVEQLPPDAHSGDGPPSTRRSSVIVRVAQAGPCSRWIIGLRANPPAPGDRLLLFCRTARMDGQPPQSSVDQNGVGEPVDEGRPEPCPQPPWSPSDVERRAVAARHVVPALQPHHPMMLSGDPRPVSPEPGPELPSAPSGVRCRRLWNRPAPRTHMPRWARDPNSWRYSTCWSPLMSTVNRPTAGGQDAGPECRRSATADAVR
jgi:hypothetical protein